MTARAHLLRLQHSLRVAMLVRALLIGACVALVFLAVFRALALPPSIDTIALLSGLVVAAWLALDIRAIQSLSRVALWVEERTPALRYSLVTIADGTTSPRLDAQATSVPWWTDVQRAVRRSLLAPVLATVVMAALFVRDPFPSLAATLGRSALIGSKSAHAGTTDVLAIVHVTVAPPAYANRASTTVDDPTSIESLVGSAITLSGNGDASSISATADSTPRAVARRGAGWSLGLTMPARPAIVRLHSAAGRDRLIVLAPIADAVPVVTLQLPAHDTIVRRATGTIVLRAQLRDDIGLHDAAFELVVSSGSGENFTFRTATRAHAMLAGRLESTLDTRLSLDSLDLKPGDILQLRAVARDGNTLTGPGIGSSETRSLRVARADEYDSVSVDAAAPPDAAAQVPSQRMLIILTEALEKRRPSLAHPVLVTESRRIAEDQRTLRKRVGDIVFQRMGTDPLSEEGSETLSSGGKLTPEDVIKLAQAATGAAVGNVMDVEGDETPILAINKPLLEAFNAMWDAGRALEIGEPAKALPPMRIALAAIQRARQAERIYLRGRSRTEIVDVARIRLTGKDKGVPSIREPRAMADPISRRRSDTFERVTGLLARDPDAAADSLLVMRVGALGDAPLLAAVLDEAARALRTRDRTAIALAWTQVRRALGAAPLQHAGISAWQGAP